MNKTLSGTLLRVIFFNLFIIKLCGSITVPNIYNIFTERQTTPRIYVDDAVIKSLGIAIKIALENCQEVFKWDRWNCPDIAFTKKHLQPTNQETAFVRAIIAASVMHTIAMNCSNGDFRECNKCRSRTTSNIESIFQSKYNFFSNGETTEQNSEMNSLLSNNKQEIFWRWTDCHSQYIKFGEDIAIKYLDNSQEKNIDLPSYIALHNYGAGRLAVTKTITKRCICHGSCTVQTCWNELSPFIETAKLLRQKYNEAVRIDFENGYDRIGIGNSAHAVHSQKLPLADTHKLVYLDDSPDYCKPNVTNGWDGTLGRTCSRNRTDKTSKSERVSCKNLCRTCGHKVKKRKRVKKWRCECNFKWCCEVTCKTCTRDINEYFCN